jgi:2,4-dienoyl-CoA reductase-like NADH-dependent reductase (Old Yellow Enzyme family)
MRTCLLACLRMPAVPGCLHSILCETRNDSLPPLSSTMPTSLFSPISLRQLKLVNRIVVSPMCQYSAVDGRATDWHTIHWGLFLQSGAGMFTIEATAVSAIGRITFGCLGLYDDACERELGERLAIARANAPSIPVALQLAHSGRKASSRLPWEGGQLIPIDRGGWIPVAPSAVAQLESEPPPKALDAEALVQIRRDFVGAAERALRIGVDAIELHMAHGYLLHEFLSPISNRRNDAYGGSFDNRVRFPMEVFAAVRDRWPQNRPLGVRISATDWVDGGWTLDDSVAFAQRLLALGCDWIDVSSGGISPAQKIPLGPGYQVPLARAIRRATSIPVVAVGLITDTEQAERIVRSQDADLVALARAMLWNPRWPWHAAAALGAHVQVPKQYWRSAPRDAQNVIADTKVGAR